MFCLALLPAWVSMAMVSIPFNTSPEALYNIAYSEPSQSSFKKLIF